MMPTPGEKRQNHKAVEAMRVKMRRCRREWANSGRNRRQNGIRAGECPQGDFPASERQTYDPRLSTVVAFADAVGKSVKHPVR